MEQQHKHRPTPSKPSPRAKNEPQKRTRADDDGGINRQQSGQRMDDSPQHAPESGEPTESGPRRSRDSE